MLAHTRTSINIFFVMNCYYYILRNRYTFSYIFHYYFKYDFLKFKTSEKCIFSKNWRIILRQEKSYLGRPSTFLDVEIERSFWKLIFLFTIRLGN